MPIEQLNSFTQILTSLNFQQGETPFKENAQNAELLPNPEDSIDLSVQAKKALGAQQQSMGQTNQAEIDAAQSTVHLDAQRNRVQISPQGTELASAQASKVAWETSSSIGKNTSAVETTKNVVGTATLDSGAKVSIYTTDFAEGEEKPFFDAPDKKVMAEITRADGSTETLAIRANTVISEDADGNLVVNSGPEKYKTSERFEINGTSKNDVIINLNGASTINCGEGNDTIFSFNMIKDLNLENGDNTFYNNYYSAIGKVTANDGNNTFIGSDYSDFDIQSVEIGNGDNNFISCKIDKLKAGDGNNNIDGGTLQNIIMGNGNNTIDIESVGSLRLGDGNNNISISGYHVVNSLINNAWYQLKNGNNIYLGNGNNTIKTTASGNIEAGNGNNFIYGMIHNLSLGSGDNIIEGSDFDSSSEWVLGNGNNQINLNKLVGGKFTFGDGDNTLIANSIVAESGRINTGKGDNKIELRGYVPGFKVDFGSGNNEFIVDGDISKLEYHGGTGDDTIEIKGNIKDSAIYTGLGQDRVTIYKNAYNSSILSNSHLSEITIYGEMINSFINKPE